MFDWSKTKVKALKVYDGYEKARDTTIHGKGFMPYEQAIRARHSPIRNVLFEVEMVHIPTFVSVHFVRHNVGVSHWVMSNRDDRGGAATVDRYAPVNHTMHCNAESLLTLAEKRLCNCAHTDTVEVMSQIKDGVEKVDPILFKYMFPRCYWRGGLCDEIRNCENLAGANDQVRNPYLTRYKR